MKTSACLTVVGLCADLVGVFIVGFLAEKWLGIFADGTRRFKTAWQKWSYRGGWGLIFGGFALQLVAQLVN